MHSDYTLQFYWRVVDYSSFSQVEAHLQWFYDQLKSVGDKKCIFDFLIEERLRSEKLDKTIPPKAKFTTSVASFFAGDTLTNQIFVISVDYKMGGMSSGENVLYAYTTSKEAVRHFRWLTKQMRGQNGKDAIRKNVILAYIFIGHRKSWAVKRNLPLLQKFVRPSDRTRPTGGTVQLPRFEH